MVTTGNNEKNNTKEAGSAVPAKLTAFDIVNAFYQEGRLANIDGVLHWLNPELGYYCPVQKYDLEKYLLFRYYQMVARTRSMQIVKTCADIILHFSLPPISSAEKEMIMCLQNGYIDLKNIEQTRFVAYYEPPYLPNPATYLIIANGNMDMTDWGFAKTISTPKMDNFVGTIAQRNQEIINRIWQMIGYLLTPDIDGKCFFLLQGLPNSGKSILGNFIKMLMPDNKIESLDIDQLGKRTATSLLVNKCLNISMDLPNKVLSPLAIRNIKLMTGNDDITVEYGNGKYLRYHGRCKFLFATNHALTLRGSDAGLEERIICIPFTNSIPIAKRDANCCNCC